MARLCTACVDSNNDSYKWQVQLHNMCDGTPNNTQQYNGKVSQTLQQYSVSAYNVQFGVTCPPTLKEERQPYGVRIPYSRK